MPARNEILPLDAAGPARGAVPKPSTPKSKPSGKPKSAFDVLSAQERRTQLVLAQKRQSNFQLFYALFGLALMVVQLEYLWFANATGLASPCPVAAADQCPRCHDSLASAVPIQEGRMILHALRVLISFSTAILLYYVYRYYAAECEVMKIKNIVPPQATVLSSSLRWSLLFELLVLCVHPFPGLEAVDPRWPNLVVATSLLMFARIALILRAMRARSSFNSSNGWFIGSLTNVDFTLAYYVKATLKNHPWRWLGFCTSALLVVASYSLFVVERFLCAFASDACCEPMALADAVMSLVMTALTIGFGDVVPHTTPGRLITVLTGTLGTLCTATTIAVMSNHLMLTRSEHKVNAFLKKDDNRRLINDHAARAIQAFVQLIGCQRRHHHGLNSKHGRAAIRRSEIKLYNVLQTYREAKRHINAHDVSDPMDKQMTMLEMMEVNVEYIRTKIEDLSELFHSQSDRGKSKRKISAVAPSGGPGGPSMLQQQQQQQDGLAKNASRTGLLVSELALNHSGGSARSLGGGGAVPTSTTPTSVVAAAMIGPKSPQVALLQNAATASSPPPTIAAAAIASSPSPSGAAMTATTPTATTTAPTPSDRFRLISRQSSQTLLRSEYDDTPEWAILLETTLQTILTQVGRVSSDVDAIKARVNEHIVDVDARISEIERSLAGRSAFREVVRTASTSRLFKRDSFAMSQTQASGSASPHQNGTAESELRTPHHPPLVSSASQPLRASRRAPVELRRPSIRNFLTQRDLDEFQNGQPFE
ncbi:hypothetical protein PybrP1_011392 [[Pythium] brassicae (nom. inval.)]|nr:hypothetical protein PybrP1_011392 [[Pythium] brassicae (nom. inval.)]